ncbi:MAG: hypothetical protein K6B68_16685 [Eubacterium sp.]|nr:hypothetical protein [Eubacterium sp.]
MATTTELFDVKKAIAEYSDKKGYTEGVKYYYGVISNNMAVKNDKEYSPIVRKFGKALRNFEENESTESLREMSEIIKGIFKGGQIPDLFESEGLHLALDNISEYLMNLSKIYNFDLYK